MVEHSLWERVAVGSNPIIPTPIYTTTMDDIPFYSVRYWQDNWEELFEKVENGETLGIVDENGNKAVMTPADEELIRMYTDHEEGS